MTLLCMMVLSLVTGSALAQSGKLVLTQGNAKIYQDTEGWAIYHGKVVVAHGDGVLDITNLPPAFKDFLDYYAALSLDKSPKRRLSKATSYTYGPLLRTKWNQPKPYNDLCPTLMDKNNDGTEVEKHTLTGCVQVSTAQVLNYFGYCKTLNHQGEISTFVPFTTVSSEFGLKEDGKGLHDPLYEGGTPFYSYVYNVKDYTPDFDKIRNDNYELAKFIYAIGLIQVACYGLDGTSASTYHQNLAFQNDYGYLTEEYVLEDDVLTTGSYIENAIKSGRPVMISGGPEDDGDGHSFIIDGIDSQGNFHVNYGWGGYADGWFTVTDYPKKQSIIVAHPADYESVKFVTMQESPKYFCVVKNGVTQEILVSNDGLTYSAEVELDGGEYEFYFKYSDGSTIAPYNDGKGLFEFSKENNSFDHHGTFVSSAKFSIKNSQVVRFVHNAAMNEITVMVTDFEVSIAGRVLDDNGDGVCNVVVYPGQDMPSMSVESENSGDYVGGMHSSNYKNGKFYTTDPISLEKKYLTAVEIFVHKVKDPRDLVVAVLDKDKNVLWKKTVSSNEVNESNWTKIFLSQPLVVDSKKQYYVALSPAVDTEDCQYFFCIDRENTKMLYKVWTSDTELAVTDSYGSYSLLVDKGFSGEVNAYTFGTSFKPLTFNNVSKNVVEKDFIGSRGACVVSGIIEDEFDNSVANAYVAASGIVPEFSVEYDNAAETSYNFSSTSFGGDVVSQAFQLKGKYIAAAEFKIGVLGTPSNLFVSIKDEYGNILSTNFVTCEEVSKAQDYMVKVVFDKPVIVNPNLRYHVSVLCDNSDDENHYIYMLGGDESLRCKVETSSEPYAKSDGYGNYSIVLDRGFSGSLYAIADNLLIDPLTFSNVNSDLKDQDFKGYLSHYSISGKVVDEKEKGLSGVMVALSENVPSVSPGVKNENDILGGFQSTQFSSNFYSQPFTVAQNYISGLDLNVWVTETKPSHLVVSIVDEDDNVVYEGNVSPYCFKGVFDSWYRLDIDKSVKVEPDKKYRIGLYCEGTDAEKGYFLFGVDADYNMRYKVYTTDDQYCTTNYEGKYTLEVKRGFSGSLYVISDSLIVEPLTFQNVTKALTEQNFHCFHKYYTVQGIVKDEDGNGVYGAVIYASGQKPTFTVGSQSINTDALARYMSSRVEYKSEPLKPAGKYISSVEFKVCKMGSPKNSIYVSIRDGEDHVLWRDILYAEDVVDWVWTRMYLDYALEIDSEKDYYLCLSTDNATNDDYYRYVLTRNGESNDGVMTHRIWTSDVKVAHSMKYGVYSTWVDRDFTGSLVAESDDYVIESPVKLDNVASNLYEKDFLMYPKHDTISGSVLDVDNHPIKGAIITQSNGDVAATTTLEKENSEKKKYQTMTAGVLYTSNALQFEGSYISAVAIQLWKVGDPKGLITVKILDEYQHELCRKAVTSAEVISQDWTKVVFDDMLEVTQGKNYYVEVVADSYDSGNCFRIYDNDDLVPLYRVWTSDTKFVSSDAKGKYTFSVDRGFVGSLYATSADWIMKPLSFNNVTMDLTEQNFTALSRYVTISGRVLDFNRNPIEGVKVALADEDKEPVSEVISKVESSANHYMYYQSSAYTSWTTDAFQPGEDCYIDAVDVRACKKGKPGIDFVVSVLDEKMNVVVSKVFKYDALPDDLSKWFNVVFDQSVKLEKGKNYYVSMSVAEKTDASNSYWYGVVGETPYPIAYQVYASPTLCVRSNSEGAYSYTVERYSSGTLNAFSGSPDLTFNFVEFNNLDSNLDEQNFEEQPKSTVYGALTIIEGAGKKIAHIDGMSVDAVDITEEITDVESLVYERQFTMGKCSTIMLPFKFDASVFDGVGTFRTLDKVYYDASMKAWVAKLSNAVSGEIAANTPYIFSPIKDFNIVEFKDIDIQPTEIKSNGNSDWQLVGVYAKKVWDGTKVPDYGFMAEPVNGLKVGDFARAGKDAWIPPLRCYLHYAGDDKTFAVSKSVTDLPDRIIVLFPDDDEKEEEQPQVVEEEQPQVEEEQPQVEEEQPQVVEEEQPQVVEEEQPQVVEEEQPQVEEEQPQVEEEEQPQVVEEEQPQVVEEEQPQVVEEEVPQVVSENQDENSNEKDVTTPVSEIVAGNGVKVWSFDKVIFIESAAGQDYIIIDASGRILKESFTTSTREEVVLNAKTSGIVVVRIANKSFKLKY